ncbi:zinc ribbon domain-containing protein [Geobacter benzoatilyticus]|uniref:Zinc ribbon domain-containing protein n=1 Tax=Geobacter benzoatilyticus TaxID=2815309 RepID=A0ABX7PZR8_9BACT|nr:zinc ribbon domain-containing protein [Geobacter benzoatilyticus]QSV44390.1 zinc ribbon domain-containing protein [Geobacter benzoatilyticus]
MAEQQTITISCPQCASPFSFREGDRNARCPSCGTSLALSGEAGIARFWIEERTDLPQARANARRAVAEAGGDPRVVERLRFEGGELCFLPFWRLRGHAAGWLWSERETVTREEEYDENGMKTVREVRGPSQCTTESVMMAVDYSSPACDVSRFGLRGIAVAGAVLPLRGMDFALVSRRGTVFDPVKGPDEVRREAVAQARAHGGGKGVLRSAARLSLCGERLSLISYPVWSLSFARGERIYPVTIDGVNGRVLSGRFPAAARLTILRPLLTVTLLVFAFTIHHLLGVVFALGFLGWLAANGGLSPERLAAWFFALAERQGEVDLG